LTERAIASPDEDPYLALALSGHSEIGDRVTVEVRCCNIRIVRRSNYYEIWKLTECSVAITEQGKDLATGPGGHGEIKDAIPVKVRSGGFAWSRADLCMLRLSERPVTVADEEADGSGHNARPAAVDLVRSKKIKRPVTIKIRGK
jgi:hypothetical protein